MEIEDFKERLLDRRTQYCQFRIQQAICLIDDEIWRLYQRLKIYNSKIIEYKEKAQDLDNQIRSAEISQDGIYRMRSADLRTAISRLKVQHCQQIREMKQNHSIEIESMQREFECILKNFTQNNKSFSANQKYIEQEKIIQKEIDLYKSKIQIYNESIQQQRQRETLENSNFNEEESPNEEINSQAIFELTRTIEERSKERYQNLINSKQKLKECIETIETMGRQHKIKIDDLSNQINSIDEDYQKSLQLMKERHDVKMISLKKQLSEVEENDKTLSKAARKLEKENRKQIKTTEIELQTMKDFKLRQSATLKEDLNNELNNYQEKINNLKSEIIRLMKKLRVREDELKERRQENQNLKREIGSLKHEIRFTGRTVGSMHPYKPLKKFQ